MTLYGIGFDLFWFTLLALPVMLFVAHRRDRVGGPWQPIAWLVMIGTAAVPALRIVRLVAQRLTVPTEWDFMSFWLGARVAAQGLNFYDPAIYRSQPLPVTQLTQGFQDEIINVGYAYPPTTMLLMLPLGWFDYFTAFAIWYAVTFTAMAVALWLLWRTLFPLRRPTDLAVIVTLALLFKPTFDTISWGQSTFLMVLILVLALRSRGTVLGPVWLAIGSIIKPFLLGPVVWFVLRRRWTALAAAALTMVLSLGLAIAVFGVETCRGFLHEGAVGRYAPQMYVQSINQSLIAITLRAFGASHIGESPLALAALAVLGLALAAVTAVAVWRGGTCGALWSFGAVSIAILLVYPHSLDHYSVVLFPWVVAMWMVRDRLLGGGGGVIAFLTIVYVLHASAEDDATFVARVLMWGAMVGLSFIHGDAAAAAERKRAAAA